jgi:hypothetical protein
MIGGRSAKANIRLRMLSPIGAAVGKVGHRQTPCKVKHPRLEAGLHFAGMCSNAPPYLVGRFCLKRVIFS